MQVFGAVEDMKQGVEFDWDGVTLEQALADCKSLAGTEYGVDWKFGGCLDIEDCDIYVHSNADQKVGISFTGVNAVKQLQDFINLVKLNK